MFELTMAAVISQNESSGYLACAKFERATFERMCAGGLGWTDAAQRAIAKLHNCDITTARALACTSWGLYQIMGFNLWDASVCDWTLDLGTFLRDAGAQTAAFERFLVATSISDITVSDLETDPEKRERFIAKYNGPGDVANYWALTQRSIAYLRARQST